MVGTIKNRDFMQFRMLVFFVIIFTFTLVACDDTPIDQTPESDYTAKITGDITADFDSYAVISHANAPGQIQVVYTGNKKLNGHKYTLSLSFFFVDSVFQSGEYRFVNKVPSTHENYAVGFFVDSVNDSSSTFFSDSGSVVIKTSGIYQTQATFKFYAHETGNSGTRSIVVDEGTLNINR